MPIAPARAGSRKPRPPSARRAVIGLRRARTTADEIAACLNMPQRTVSRVCARAGLGRLRALDPSEPANRFATARPGQLVHIDVKRLGRIGRAGHRVHGDRRS